jgi:16S rRNA (uracil1498-N3)-methyltransferase
LQKSPIFATAKMGLFSYPKKSYNGGMKLQRFIGDFSLKEGAEIIIEDPEMLNQLKNVFRLGTGDKLILCDGAGNETIGEIRLLTKQRAEIMIGEVCLVNNSSRTKVSLYLAILKNDHFDLVVQKATEVGISEIIPLVTKRTIKTNLKYDRLKKIIKEASEQSGRGELTRLKPAMTFSEAILSADGEKVLFDSSGQNLTDVKLTGGTLSIFVGPEGGWEASEIDVAGQNGFKIINLGVLTLRAETAAIIASFLSVNI